MCSKERRKEKENSYKCVVLICSFVLVVEDCTSKLWGGHLTAFHKNRRQFVFYIKYVWCVVSQYSLDIADVQYYVLER